MNLTVTLRPLVYTWGDLDYVPPVRYPEDLFQVTAQSMADLVERITRKHL